MQNSKRELNFENQIWIFNLINILNALSIQIESMVISNR